MKNSRRTSIILILLVILGLYGKSQPRKPNIIWIIAEDLSAADLPAYGNSIIATPTIDSLVSSGYLFKRAYATSGVCAPSRSALMVGKYQTTFGANHMKLSEDLFPALPDSVLTAIELFNLNGYNTFYFGKDAIPGLETIDKSAHWMFKRRNGMEWKVSHLTELSDSTPFFGIIDFQFSHRPFTPDTLQPVSASKIQLPPYYPTNSIVRKDWKFYLESIQQLDRQLSVLFNKLRALGLLKNTVVFFLSDHGRPMTRSKYWLYEGGLHVPLIVSMPDYMIDDLTPVNRDSPVSLVDLLPTSLQLAGISTTAQFDGIPLFVANNRKSVFAASDRIGELHFKSRAVITDRYKYIVNYHYDLFESVNDATTVYGKANYPAYHVINRLNSEGRLNTDQQKLTAPIPYEELYDVQNDPYELHNLVDSANYYETTISLRTVLDKWMSENDRTDRFDSKDIECFFNTFQENSTRSNKKKAIMLYQEVKASMNDNNR